MALVLLLGDSEGVSNFFINFAESKARLGKSLQYHLDMKSILKTLILTLPAAAMLTLTACSTIERSTTDTRQTGHSGKKRNHRDVLPEDRQQFILDRAAAAYTPDELGKGIIKGDWAIEEVHGRSTLGMEEPP